nr:MAG TPA: hypothetical protein [Caudoviricetes sp.]
MISEKNELVSMKNELDELTNKVSKNIRKLLDVKTKEKIVVDIDRIIDLEQQMLNLKTKE